LLCTAAAGERGEDKADGPTTTYIHNVPRSVFYCLEQPNEPR